MNAHPYLFFSGTCTKAVAFYRDRLGAEVRALVHFRDFPGAAPDAGDKIMHAELCLGDSIIFASDGRRDGGGKGVGYAIALQAANDLEAERLFAALTDDGVVEVPLMTTPFASRFGKAIDRFGTPWMVTTPQTATA
ncbi:MAG: glyoxalase/bleomycin resistance/extradiol dioxygenase family protein [Alphaproteobacteria bacterium]|nr:glyoxalase/bleomycin resistance/extradiol dioxygenase family protein [Alphaproteobacteria bacterium]